MELNEAAKKTAKAIAEELIADAQIPVMAHVDNDWGRGYDEGYRIARLGDAIKIARRFGHYDLAGKAFDLMRPAVDKIKSK